MTTQHPRLPVRPIRNPNLKRPTRNHPLLGEIEFVSGNGTWWESKHPLGFGDTFVKYDCSRTGPLTPEMLDASAAFFTKVSANEVLIREEIACRLTRGEYRDTAWKPDTPKDLPKLKDPNVAQAIRPFLFIDFGSSAWLEYELDDTPDGKLLGANRLQARVDEDCAISSIQLFEDDCQSRVERMLERPLPGVLPDYVNSLPDQFVVAASGGIEQLRKSATWLKPLLQQATAEVDGLMKSKPIDCGSYLRSVRRFLSDLAVEMSA